MKKKKTMKFVRIIMLALINSKISLFLLRDCSETNRIILRKLYNCVCVCVKIIYGKLLYLIRGCRWRLGYYLHVKTFPVVNVTRWNTEQNRRTGIHQRNFRVLLRVDYWFIRKTPMKFQLPVSHYAHFFILIRFGSMLLGYRLGDYGLRRDCATFILFKTEVVVCTRHSMDQSPWYNKLYHLNSKYQRFRFFFLCKAAFFEI